MEGEIIAESTTNLFLKDNVCIDKLELMCKLETLIHGTKQVSQGRNQIFHFVLTNKLGFVGSGAAPWLYVKCCNSVFIMIASHGDCLLRANKKILKQCAKQMLSGCFEMIVLRMVKAVLGLEIFWNLKWERRGWPSRRIETIFVIVSGSVTEWRGRRRWRNRSGFVTE